MQRMIELDEVGFYGSFVDEAGHFEFEMMYTVAEDPFKKNIHDYILGATEEFQSIEAYLNKHRHSGFTEML